MLPVIGISVSPTLVQDRLMEAVNRVYVTAVSMAGGLPIILPTLDPKLVGTMLDRLDGVVLSGGGDVHPSCYGEDATPALSGVDEQRDTWELAVARGCFARGLPLLGVCRGMQVANVALGGTLVQHVPDRTATDHCRRDRFAETVHPVSVEPGSTLAAVLRCAELGVNTLHHQAVDRLGAGVRITAWAPDATIEAIESTGSVPFLGVQWHPELLTAIPAHQALFTWVVEAARAGRDVARLGATGAAAGIAGEPDAAEISAGQEAA